MDHSPSSSRDRVAAEILPTPRFDVISEDPSDHQFTNSSSSTAKKIPLSAPKVSRELQKHIAHEWKLLAENLPETIFARAYETRIDLLRAAIIGAAGTPYHDGLFFFDVVFPPGYPACPPKVHYRSYGYQINPNLYHTGKVCLSLLNTWFGRNSSERWDPKTSTMLQILLSLQALVLNEWPYFNEPAFIGSRRDPFHKKAYAYNGEVFLLSCQTMTHVMSRPPKGFESFVKDHFRDRGHVILAACEAYFSGRVPVGRFGLSEAGTTTSFPGMRRGPSEKLRSGLVHVYPFLVKWLGYCGAEVGPRRVLKARVENEDNMDQAKDKVRKDGKIKVVLGRVLGKFKRIIGLKK
ncbi:hypothetical protein MLD38_010729 [Melastoma candidum]|uniref:Uncharacterized protein n=1 Tax=Melastoma candidum TaxID=119954 RepID=A0ACB9R0F0_9MYRT|nr:hypothetical protein MLD38_010729 [Melastoma candidum]